MAAANYSHNAELDGLEVSTLDDLTHAEMRLLYRESVETIRFAKTKQWKTLGATLLLLGGVLVLDHAYPNPPSFGRVLMIISLMISGGAVYSLAIYQAWQHTERDKLNAITRHFSTLTHRVRAIKSRREANVFRYMLLTFLIAGVIMGEVIVLMVLTGAAG